MTNGIDYESIIIIANAETYIDILQQEAMVIESIIELEKEIKDLVDGMVELRGQELFQHTTIAKNLFVKKLNERKKNEVLSHYE